MRFKFFLTVLIDNIKFEIELNNKKQKNLNYFYSFTFLYNIITKFEIKLIYRDKYQ